MKSKRVFSLDLIRVISILLVINYHFSGATNRFRSVFLNFANGDFGGVGAMMFFVLSGYVLHLKYKNVDNIGFFYKKRFLAIFPDFYITFTIFYIAKLFVSKNPFYGGALWHLIYTLLGIDNYLKLWQLETYALVGEWFTAIIVINYLLYPLISKLIDKIPIAFFSLLSCAYLAITFFYPIKGLTPNANPITGIWLFCLGMILEKYFDKYKKKYLVGILSFIGAIIVIFIELPKSVVYDPLLAIFIFVTLLFLARLFENVSFIKNVVGFLSKISYVVYLSHHIIMYGILKVIGQLPLSTIMVLVIYFIILLVVLLYSTSQYYITDFLRRKIKAIKQVKHR